MDLTAHGHRQRDDRRFAERRAMNQGFGDAMARAVELVLTPIIFGFLGYLVDGWLGTAPIFMLGLGAFTVGYVMWRMKTGYDAAMDAQSDIMRAPQPTPKDADG